jgi:hypothetical protein
MEKRLSRTPREGPNLLRPLRLLPGVKKSLTTFRAQLRGHRGNLSPGLQANKFAQTQGYSWVNQLGTFAAIWPGEATDLAICPRRTISGAMTVRHWHREYGAQC